MLKIQLIVFALLIVNIYSKPAEEEYTWESYKHKHNKNYTNSSEDSKRKSIWQTNYDIIKKHNSEADQNVHTYRLGINKFSDLSLEEFQKQRLGLQPDETSVKAQNSFHNNRKHTTRRHHHHHHNSTYASTTTPILSTTIPIISTTTGQQPVLNGKDWRLSGGVSPVKDQSQCGSCWAFSTTGAIESQYLIKKKKSVILSEQNLVDCSSSYGNDGCDGGWPDYAFEYVKAKGIDNSISYSYKGTDQSCKFSSSNVAATIKSYYSSGNDETEMTQNLHTVGPVSTTLNADILQHYSSGIVNSKSCSTQMNHAVLAVGYGTTINNLDYYIIKNSWGSDWGENGFFRIARNKNMCGIASYYAYPILA